MSLSKDIAEKLLAGDLSWPEVTLATWEGATGRNIPIQGVNSTSNQMFESVSNGFRPQQVPFMFFSY